MFLVVSKVYIEIDVWECIGQLEPFELFATNKSRGWFTEKSSDCDYVQSGPLKSKFRETLWKWIIEGTYATREF